MQTLLRLVFTAGMVLSLFACRQNELPNSLHLLNMLYASPKEEGYLPLKMFTENDSLFVQYIKNGKPLAKIHLSYGHADKKEECFYFIEMINDKRSGGIYIMPDDIYNDFDYYRERSFVYRDKYRNEIHYVIDDSYLDKKSRFIRIIDWIKNNCEWIFSGIGVLVIGTLLSKIRCPRLKK